jgi:hypothetical protein
MMMMTSSASVLVLGLAHAALGCSGRCAEGATQACACVGGATGVQTCNADGALGACDCGQLSEAEARRLITAQPDFTDGVMCGVQVTPRGAGRYSIEGSTYSRCGQVLEDAHLARLGGCAVPTCGAVVIEATPPARFEGIYLRFPCGSVRLLGVSGIATTGSTATFRYEREVTLDQAVLSAVSACRLDVATAGRAERERTVRRDDAGHWSLVSATR